MKPYDITPSYLKTPSYLNFDISKYSKPTTQTSKQSASTSQEKPATALPKEVTDTYNKLVNGTFTTNGGGTKTSTPQKVSTSSTKKTGKTAEQKYQEDLKKEIQNAYQNQINFLSGQEADIQAALPGQLEQIGAQYENLRPGLEQQLALQQESGTQGIEQQKQAELQNVAGLRRQAEEQGLRAVQQFGGVGGSSAAQAAGELIAREQLRATGAAANQRATNIQSIQNQLRAIQAEYDSNVNKLNLEKERALQTARNEFNTQINNIKQAKMQAGVTKASQTISALQDFATRRREIENQSTALENNLTLLKQQAESQANLLRLQSSLATPQTTQVDFARLFVGPNDQKMAQSNEAAKLLQTLSASGNLKQYGITDLGIDPVTKERLYSTTSGIIDSAGNLRSGTAQYNQQNPSWWDSLFQ